MKKKTLNIYQIINIIIKLNRYTIRNTNLPFDINAFAENFVDYIIALLINFFFNYN